MVNKTLSKLAAPFAWLLRQVVPKSVIKAAIESCLHVGKYLADKNKLLAEGHCKKIADLSKKKPDFCDKLANNVHNWAIATAVLEGGLTGGPGLAAAPLDIPAIITLAFRTICKIGYCYGYERNSKIDKQFVMGIMAVAGANDAASATLRFPPRLATFLPCPLRPSFIRKKVSSWPCSAKFFQTDSG